MLLRSLALVLAITRAAEAQSATLPGTPSKARAAARPPYLVWTDSTYDRFEDQSTVRVMISGTPTENPR
jgi:hypothetical protein